MSRTSSTKTLADAYSAGVKAGEKPGKNFSDNPYSMYDVNWVMWRAGFREGTKSYLRLTEASRKAYDASK
jgi:hypothetical protein